MGRYDGEQILEKKKGWWTSLTFRLRTYSQGGKKEINDILRSDQWETNGVRPYAKSVGLFKAHAKYTDISTKDDNMYKIVDYLNEGQSA